jgi:hypothetical protein
MWQGTLLSDLYDLMFSTLQTSAFALSLAGHHDMEALISLPLIRYCTIRWLSEADAAAGVWQKHRAYVTTAWHFLNDHGYINFGVAAAIHAKMLTAPASKGAVIVIGAGMAGVSHHQQ